MWARRNVLEIREIPPYLEAALKKFVAVFHATCFLCTLSQHAYHRV